MIVSESIKNIAYKKSVEIIKRFENFRNYNLEDLFVTMCKEDKQLSTYFGYDKDKSLKIEDNHKVSDVKKLLLNHSNIKRVQDNPIVLKWFEGPQPQNPTNLTNLTNLIPENYPDREKNKKNNFYESDSEPRSDTSDTSDMSDSDLESIKGVQFHPKGKIHEISEEQYRELNDETRDLN